MPRKRTKLVVAKARTKLVVVKARTAEARRLVTRQQDLIATLKLSKQPTVDAEGTLQTYISALKHLEAHEDKVRAEVSARKHETKRDRRFRTKTPPDSN